MINLNRKYQAGINLDDYQLSLIAKVLMNRQKIDRLMAIGTLNTINPEVRKEMSQLRDQVNSVINLLEDIKPIPKTN